MAESGGGGSRIFFVVPDLYTMNWRSKSRSFPRSVCGECGDGAVDSDVFLWTVCAAAHSRPVAAGRGLYRRAAS